MTGRSPESGSGTPSRDRSVPAHDVQDSGKDGSYVQTNAHCKSTWLPMIDLITQKVMDIYRARADDFQKAAQRVYSSQRYP